MADYPSGIYTLAEPERVAIRTWDPTNDWNNSYMTNGTLFCIPEGKANGWQCVNPRRDYQNDVRLNLTTADVVEVRAAYTNFTQGVAKICLLPEYFPGEVRSEYNGIALFVELARSGGDLQVTAYRHVSTAADGTTNISSTVTCAYVPGQGVSMQVGATNAQVYYGTTLVTDVAHGLTNIAAVFTNGVFPHYEFQNVTNTSSAVVQMNGLRSQSLTTFTVPPE